MGREVDRQYLAAMKSIWDTVDKMWDPCRLLAQLGHQFCQTWAVRASHHEFPYALNMLSLMCPLTNGARVSIFPTSLCKFHHSRVGQDCAEPSEQGHPRASGGRTGAGSQLELHAVHVLCFFKQCTSASVLHDFVAYRPCQAERCGAVCSNCKRDS